MEQLGRHGEDLTPQILLVMGAYAHSKLLQIVLGGVTSHTPAEAELPKCGHGGQHAAARRQGSRGLST
jgi:hypothetical protein